MDNKTFAAALGWTEIRIAHIRDESPSGLVGFSPFNPIKKYEGNVPNYIGDLSTILRDIKGTYSDLRIMESRVRMHVGKGMDAKAASVSLTDGTTLEEAIMEAWVLLHG